MDINSRHCNELQIPEGLGLILYELVHLEQFAKQSSLGLTSEMETNLK
jgi:hypothetical protein